MYIRNYHLNLTWNWSPIYSYLIIDQNIKLILGLLNLKEQTTMEQTNDVLYLYAPKVSNDRKDYPNNTRLYSSIKLRLF